MLSIFGYLVCQQSSKDTETSACAGSTIPTTAQYVHTKIAPRGVLISQKRHRACSNLTAQSLASSFGADPPWEMLTSCLLFSKDFPCDKAHFEYHSFFCHRSDGQGMPSKKQSIGLFSISNSGHQPVNHQKGFQMNTRTMVSI